MLWSDEIVEIFVFVVENVVIKDVVVERCFERCLRIGDGTECRKGQKFVFFENDVAGDNEFLFLRIPESIDVIANVSE